MIAFRPRLAMLLVALAAAVSAPLFAESPSRAFARSWEGRIVVVRQPLFTLVYNERGRLGTTHSGRRDGLIVVTPFQGVHFRFDGRQGRDDVEERDPQRIIPAVTAAYQGDALDVRPYQRIEPVLIARYEAGAELVVRDVRIERDRVRLSFAQSTGPNAAGEPVTSLTVKWPTPLSRSLSERALIENLIHRFVALKPAP